MLYLGCQSRASEAPVINKSDEKDLEIFFRTLIYGNHFGYTLFGDKPISIAGYFVQQPTNNLLAGHRTNICLGELWKTWGKYASQINSKNYLILNEKTGERLGTITLINKRAFLKTVEEHLNDFQAVLGEDMTPKKLMEQIATPNASLFDILHRNEILYGILLGYGKKNALAYKRRSELMRFTDPIYRMMPVHKDLLHEYSLYFPRPRPPFATIEEEYNDIESRITFSGGEPKLSPIDIPRFVAIADNPETKCLNQKYRRLHQKLLKIYSKGDFLTITLNKLFEDCSINEESKTENTD